MIRSASLIFRCAIAAVFVIAAGCQENSGATAPTQLEADVTETEALKIANQMVDAWEALDLDGIISTFAEDGILHSMMIEPIVGREELRSHIGKVINGATRLDLKLKTVAVSGNTVMLERVDDFDVNGQSGAVPVVGVLVIEDGHVAEWREYYDRNQLLSEMGVKTDYYGGGKNIDIYLAAVSAWREKDLDTVMEQLTDDIEFHSLVGRDPHRGSEDVRAFLQGLSDSMTDNKLRVINYAENGDNLLVEGVEDFIDAEGRRIQIPYVGTYKIRDGKIARWRDYFDPAIAERIRNNEPMSASLKELVSAGDE